ncbi:MAG: LCP family protein [Defluviitaleaceae bacterium]|nr:LCP family protein [Defluviitaleaceae bacterium]
MINQNKSVKTFMKVFAVAAGALVLFAGIGLLIATNAIRPPAVPTIPLPSTSSQEESEYLPTSSCDNLLPPSPPQFEERRPNFFTFVIFGLTEGMNANTIMVAAYDAETRQGYIISIPRDTRVDVERNNRKIVAAYPVGRLGGRGHEGGVERMKYEVQTLVGFRPDFYISVDYEAFVRMVDAVGGVEIYVPFRMFYNDIYQNLFIDLQAGLQVLNGHDALLFSRYRTGTPGISPTISDYQRIEHQQQVLAAVMRELLTPASILRIPEFISIFNSYVDSDLSSGELLWFANQSRVIGGLDAINLYTLPMTGTSGPPRWYELADEEGILELVNRTINPLERDITSNDLRIAQ